MNMTRREAVIKMAIVMGASTLNLRLIAAEVAPAAGSSPPIFSADEIALLDEIGETIIPATDVPGAKAAGIGAFIAMMVRDCYVPRDQAAVKEGLQKIAGAHSARFGSAFVQGKPADRTTLLNELDREIKQPAPPDATGPHYFKILKELTIVGYFSSEIGCKQALRFIEVPGRFDGSAPYKKGEHAWFN